MNRHIVKICLLGTLLGSGTSFSAKEGNGGSRSELKFRSIAYRAAKVIAENQAVFPTVPAEKFSKMIEDMDVEMVLEELYVDGVKKDAVNYPDLKLIKIYRPSWLGLTARSAEQVSLVAHEVFALIGIDDSRYQLSTRILALLPTDAGPLFRWSCSAASVRGGFGEIRWAYGEGDTAGEAWRELNEIAEGYWGNEGYSMVTGVQGGHYVNVSSLEPATILNSCLKN